MAAIQEGLDARPLRLDAKAALPLLRRAHAEIRNPFAAHVAPCWYRVTAR